MLIECEISGFSFVEWTCIFVSQCCFDSIPSMCIIWKERGRISVRGNIWLYSLCMKDNLGWSNNGMTCDTHVLHPQINCFKHDCGLPLDVYSICDGIAYDLPEFELQWNRVNILLTWGGNLLIVQFDKQFDNIGKVIFATDSTLLRVKRILRTDHERSSQ